jgi:8-oxo-dGTP pyrophosphatase MutT (NUDIX family)
LGKIQKTRPQGRVFYPWEGEKMEKIQVAALEKKLQTRTPGLMDATKRYAVLVPLVRAGNMRRQPGEVCFPGGRMEGTETAEECALRETEEELSIPRSAVQVLGRLDFIAHRANFILYPILGLVERDAVDRMTLNPDEVAETFQMPLSHLLTTPPLEYDYPLQPKPGEDFPYELLAFHGTTIGSWGGKMSRSTRGRDTPFGA